MRLIDEEYTRHPFYGSRRMVVILLRQGWMVNRKRVQRLMRLMGLEAMAPRPSTSGQAPGHKVYPYLLRGVAIERPDQVWSTDITYIPLARGSCTWRRSSTGIAARAGLACRTAGRLVLRGLLDEALSGHGKPEIFNTDQGVQFTSQAFTGVLKREAWRSAWTAGAVPGQRVRGAAVAEREVRGRVPERATRRWAT